MNVSGNKSDEKDLNCIIINIVIKKIAFIFLFFFLSFLLAPIFIL